MILVTLLKSFITTGTLHIIDAKGQRHTLRGQDNPDPEVTIRIHNKRTEWRILFRPALAIGEAYMEGSLTVDGDDIYPLVALFNRNIFRAGSNPLSKLQRILTWPKRLLPTRNSLKKARLNALHTYNLDVSFYKLFLDKHMQYSCAYFPHGDETLEEAQEAKMRHIAAKLLLKPGNKVLEIGCGWGGLAAFVSQLESISWHGLTLSDEQCAEAKRRAKEKGLSDRVNFSLRDYRKENEKYDRIVSVGMFEHVGLAHYREYFAQVKNCLTEDGVALIHFIGHADEPGENNAWLTRYIFPGGYTPSLSEVMPFIEEQRMFVTDIEVWRQQYSPTLAAWRKNLHAHKEEIVKRYSEQFFRMFDFYFAGCEAAMQEDTYLVFQIQLANRMNAVPFNREYIERWKAGHQKPLSLQTSALTPSIGFSSYETKYPLH